MSQKLAGQADRLPVWKLQTFTRNPRRGARALCVELDPRYADVVLRRVQEHTGVLPELNGEPVSFAAGTEQ